MSRPSTLVSAHAFSRLGTGDTAMLAAGLRPLPWIDGLLTATVVSPETVDLELWMESVCSAESWGSLTLPETKRAVDLLTDRQAHIAKELADDPENYRPFFGEGTDRLAAAAEWAGGFRAGMRLQPEPWRPLIDDDLTRGFLSLIFNLERDEDLSTEEQADRPFADVSPERRHEMRVTAIDLLHAAVLGLHAASKQLAVSDAGADVDLFADARLPYWRAAPKVGRNDPCSCGSGKKYKKCCLNAAASSH